MISRRLIISIERGEYYGDMYGVKKFADFDQLPVDDERLARYLLDMFRELELAIEKETRPSEFN